MTIVRESVTIVRTFGQKKGEFGGQVRESVTIVRESVTIVQPFYEDDKMNILEERDDAMRTYAFGWDFGNTETDAVMIVRGKQIRFTTPTAFVRVDTTTMQSLASLESGEEVEQGNGRSKNKAKTKGNVADTVVVIDDPNAPSPVIEPDKIIVQLQGESMSFAFGHLALTQKGDPWTGRGDYHRYATSYALRGLLASSALMQTDKEYGLFVVAGLPAGYYLDHPELRDAIKDRLNGTYTFTVDGGQTWRTSHIEVAAIVMEGAGALITFPGLSKTSEAAVIDIGGGTTDLYAQLGATPLDDFCKGTPVAVESATKIVKKTFLSKYKRPLTDKEARDTMRAFALGKKKHFPQVAAFGVLVPVEELQLMVEEAVGSIAEDIVGFISAIWGDGIARFVPILLIGGGAFYFFDAIKNRIGHILQHEDPTFANAIGYATLAARKLLKKMQTVAVEKAKVMVVDADVVAIQAERELLGIEAGVASQE